MAASSITTTTTKAEQAKSQPSNQPSSIIPRKIEATLLQPQQRKYAGFQGR